jgi:serine/threonine protein kinase
MTRVDRSRLVREAKLAASLNHPAICTIHDVGELDSVVYVAMELVGGSSLADLIPASGLPADQVLRYGREMAEAVAHAHEHGIVHRDLNPIRSDARFAAFMTAQQARWEEFKKLARR